MINSRDCFVQYKLYLCLYAHNGVQHILTIWVTLRVSYKKQYLLVLRGDWVHPQVFGGIRVANLISVLFCILLLCLPSSCILCVQCCQYLSVLYFLFCLSSSCSCVSSVTSISLCYIFVLFVFLLYFVCLLLPVSLCVVFFVLFVFLLYPVCLVLPVFLFVIFLFCLSSSCILCV